MKVIMNKAGNGDCFLVQTEKANLLIDGGIASSFKTWSGSLANLESLDALIITHIDCDHTNGIIKFVDDKIFDEIDISNILFNGVKQITQFEEGNSSENSSDYDAIASNFDNTDVLEVDIGFSEGTSLSYLLESKKLIINDLNGGKAIHNDSFHTPIKIKDISIQILGPSLDSLKKLKQNWSEILDERGIKRRIINKKHAIAFESYINSLSSTDNEESNISATVSTSIEELCNREYERDTSLSNESSLSFILSDSKKSILMLGDSHIETVIKWLDKNQIDKLQVDAIKLSHHGSRHNINAQFLQRVDCNNFLISTNGKKHNHPDLETLALIAKYCALSETNIYLNYKLENIPPWFIKTLNNLPCPVKIHFESKEILL